MAIERWLEFTDEQLVVAALLGDIAAFDVLVLRYRPAVRAAVSRQTTHRGLVEDICQETFLLAFRALPQLQDAGRFGAWLHAIARRQAIRHSQGEARAWRNRVDTLVLEHSEVLSESGWEALERQEVEEWVRQAMATLPEEFQFVLQLRYWSEMPLERIASFLGLPLSTVKWRLHRARHLMRGRLSADEVRKHGDTETRSSTGTGEGKDQHGDTDVRRRKANETKADSTSPSPSLRVSVSPCFITPIPVMRQE